jgi:hypothetical protein
MRGYRRSGFAATIVASALSLMGRSPPLAAHAMPPPTESALAQAPLNAQNTLSSKQGTSTIAPKALPDGPLAPDADQSLIADDLDLAVGEERKRNGRVTPIFVRAESKPLQKVAQNTPPAAQGAALPAAAVAQASPTSDAEKIEQLQQRIDRRDVIIRDLLQRVESLERERSGGADSRTDPPSAAASAAAATSQASTSPPQPTQLSTQTAQASAPAAPQPPSEPAPAGPGSFAVTDEDAERALERALVQTGAALLPLGRFEFVPSLTYQFRRDAQPGQIALTTDGGVLITENVTRSTQVEANALIRVGLPWDAQAEIGIPFDYKSLGVTSSANGAGLSEQTVDVQGLGDVSFSLTKQILAAGDVRPGLFMGGGWNSDFGQTKRSLPLGTGFHELSVGLTAVKRQDPMVFTLGFTYQDTLEKNRLKPGDQYITSLGVLLAVSPETSLRFGQQISFGGRDAFNGVPIPGTEKTSGIFTFGLLSILGRGLVINLNGGIGETPDAPDLFMQLAFPIRLN